MLTATREYIEGLCLAIGKETGVRFEAGSRWAFDVKHRVMEYDIHHLKTLPFDVAKGLILHETAHLKYTVDNGPSELEKKLPAMHGIYNAFEDIRIEKKLQDELGDFANEGISAINYYGSGTIINKLKTDPTGVSDLDKVLFNQLSDGNYQRTMGTVWHDDAYEIENKLQSFFPYSIREKISIRPSDIYRQITECENLTALKKWVDTEIYPKIKDLIPTDNPTPPPSLTEPVRRPSWGKTKSPPPPPVKNQTIPSDQELTTLLHPYIDTLANKLRDVLKETTSSRYNGSYHHGRLLSKNSYKVVMGESRVFSKKTTPNKPDYHITYILDQSGSMRHLNRHTNVYIGAFLLSQACKKLGFGQTFIHYNDHAYLIPSLESYRKHLRGENDDHEAVELALSKLDTSKNNIVFMLTDGGVCDDPSEPIAKIIKTGAVFIPVAINITQDDFIEQFNKFYPSPVFVPQVEDIPTVLINQLKKIIHR